MEQELRRKGIQPFVVDDWACEGIFDSDDELDDFLQFTYAARQADLA